MDNKKLHLISYACASAGAEMGCQAGPVVLQQSSYLAELNKLHILYQWDALITSAIQSDQPVKNIIQMYGLQLANIISQQVKQQQYFVVLGGDHSSAIGTWSGVYDACYQQGALGLIWIDAHMDSHTPETTESGRIHGMPVATLLGYGYPELTTILHYAPKLHPKNLCLIGVRSFEQAERDLLQRLQVRIFYMEEVQRRGMQAVFQEALEIVNNETIGYGISIDIDSLDPREAPGVDVPEPNGIHAQDLCDVLSSIASDKRCFGAEIAEFDPYYDKNKQTEQWIIRFLAALGSSQVNCCYN
ncbi:MAG: hypothetical protein A3E83_07795 [Gammaproteobacteria bacterium RIFCSPHIGHO2_12_FULL_41_20]|nr:MAG: hypothetical protein A3E83_07795 [Gammaproteobacteria bacterium RIFCSPHIGHO2_12_FULL_41_20]